VTDREYCFTFGTAVSRVHIRRELPSLREIRRLMPETAGVLLVCDTHTEYLARRILGDEELPLRVLEPGEEAKTWASVEAVLEAAHRAGLGRDGLFIGVGGGVVGDLTAFAASIYMRGAALCLVPTTLLGMIDAALGGKTGFDLEGIKNLAGSFFPAGEIFAPLESLAALPGREWKSGMAELIKTAVLADPELFELLKTLGPLASPVFDQPRAPLFLEQNTGPLLHAISRAVEAKGRIVERDPRETGSERALLNLGHTFGHALEAAAGLGRLSHGEAVAWGMIRAGELGLALGLSPPQRVRDIAALIRSCGYETAAPHREMKNRELFLAALGGDKKKRGGKINFVIPAREGARLVPLSPGEPVLARIIDGEYASCF
jgi:3-dehydroquinate synthase